MKKSALILIIAAFCAHPVFSNEVVDDYFDIASAYCVSGNYQGAISYLNKILTIEPDNKKALEQKHILQQLQIPHLKSYITSKNPKLDKSMEFKKAGNKAEELAVLTAAANANDYWAICFLGDYYKNLGEYKTAIQYYAKALQLRPAFTQNLMALAVCSYEIMDYNEVKALMDEYIKHNPQEAFAYALRAKAYLKTDMLQDAESDINAALALDDDPLYEFIHGVILYKRHNFKLAQSVFYKLSNEIQISDVYKYLGLCDYQLKDYANALLNIDKAIILSDEDKSLNNTYNEIKLKLSESLSKQETEAGSDEP